MIDVLRARRARGRVTARDFAQTRRAVRALRDRARRSIGRHRGGRLGRQGASAWPSARRALARWARAHGRFDLALGHGSNDVTVAARLLRIPCSTMFDYEWATRPAHRQLPPRAGGRRARRDPARAAARYGATRQAAALRRGSRRSTTSPTSSPTRRSSTSWGSTARSRSPSCARRRRSRSTTASRTTLFGDVLERAARTPGGRAAAHRRAARRADRAGGFIVPERAIDAQSLIAYADLVVCAGGTMNREAGRPSASRAGSRTSANTSFSKRW